MESKFCRRCGRQLKSEQSRQLGFGRICWEKTKNECTIKPLFKTEVIEDDKQQPNDIQVTERT
jgi:hypothetical protein